MFALTDNYWECGQYHDDSRVFKMALEAAQVAHCVLQDWRDPDCYKPSHARHPITLWAASSAANLQSVIVYGLGCLRSAEQRYGRSYPKVRTALEWALRRLPDLENAERTEQPQCMPDEFKSDDLIEAYRSYMESKSQRWKRTNKPSWN